MQITSFEFILFFAVVLLVYHGLPPRFRCAFLLISSYFFYGCQNRIYLCFLALATLITYAGALLLQRYERKERQIVLAVTLSANLLILGYFKYADFLSGGRIKSILLPVGISFYLFMSMGYVIDVYREIIPAEKNLISYALFVSFFPTILSGPIERAGNMLVQFKTDFLKNVKFDPVRIRDGFVRMLWGYFMKLVLADRIAILVDQVYASPEKYGGAIVATASILYTLQIYCDFAGYSNIAIGAAQTLGIKVMDNFRSPYLAGSISDFWRRWHISLSSWFRDYVYIPLGGNRKGKIRKYLNIMIVFLLSGLWHGAGWTFVLWGGLHGLYQVVGALLTPVKKKLAALLGVEINSISIRLVKIGATFFLVNNAWILFRAQSMSSAAEIFERFLHPQIWQLFDGTLYTLGLDAVNIRLMLIGLLIVIFVDILNEKGFIVSKCIARERLWIRWPIYIGAVLVILLCGIWGAGFDATNFIYYQF